MLDVLTEAGDEGQWSAYPHLIGSQLARLRSALSAFRFAS
jgi:hypothetical protein